MSEWEKYTTNYPNEVEREISKEEYDKLKDGGLPNEQPEPGTLGKYWVGKSRSINND